ncbi:hypothetical protein NMK71_04835 [Weeksellaceae bacterium KMM 9713]|uniref:Uncharacterized protein n=1 Tax=Profundicola chukchiensis TaxID=2961959 RepID=A0A9X4N020_9FLAO|nr:hypothetical protein [Profundicola chukchiensis]MDG4945731.1 hypothetical protein [Profundicola chukchiensis]
MSQKIYISLKESESLIFNKSLNVLEKRLEIEQAKGLLSVNIIVNNEDLLYINGEYIVLLSAVRKFEIPREDLNLFLNHYKVPPGLINTVDRKVRDIFKNEIKLSFEKNEESEEYKNYLRLRNALVGVLHYNYEMYATNHKEYDAHSILNSFTNLSEIKKLFLINLFKEETIPILIVNVNKFVTDHFYRVTWWGKFITDNYLKTLNIENEEEVKNIRLWLRAFLEFDNINTINKQLTQVPKDLKKEINFLLGYYFNAIKFESFHLENNYFFDLYDEIVYEHKNELFYWISFFNSFYNPNIIQIYFIESLQHEVYKLEKLAFELTQNNLTLENSERVNFDFKKIDKGVLISEYDQLNNGVSKKSPLLIKANEAKGVYKNQLFRDNLQNIGFEINFQFEAGKLLNYCWNTKSEFALHLTNNMKISDIVFYINSDSKAQQRLKDLKIKTKRIDRLLDKKKVLVAFISQKETPKLIQLYSSILRQEIAERFDKVLIVLLVNLKVEDLQSLEFDRYLKSQEQEYQRLFSNQIELIVKNIHTKNDSEIKRNLKNSLEKYRINQIEVVDENFDNKEAIWLIESGTEYYIDEENKNFYSVINQG